MASPSVIQTREGEWTSEKYWNVLGVNIPDFFTNDPALLADYIAYFDTRADDVFVVSYPKSGSFIIILYTDNLRVSATTVRVEFKCPFLEVDLVLMYRSNRSFNITPRAAPRAFDFFENYCSNFPLPGPKCRSNAPH